MPPFRRPPFRRSPAAIVAVVLAVVPAACGGTDGHNSGPVSVVVTVAIWADVVGELACGSDAMVERLIPAGSDPHDFEPSLADRELLGDAAVVFANGLGLEATAEDTLAAVADGGTPVVELAPQVTDGDDPHVWQDPTSVISALPIIADALVEHAGFDRASVDRCATAYGAEVEALDRDIAAAVGAIPADRRLLVTEHVALGYFAERYDFEVVGTVIPSSSTSAETNPADLDELASAIVERNVTTIFAEAQHSGDEARALADRIGAVRVVTLHTDSLGEPGSGADTYLGLMRTNVDLIIDGLGAPAGGDAP